jgi:Family of unknown function (DUF6232)
VTVFYRGRYALITHEVFEVRYPVSASFPLRELVAIQIVQEGPARATGALDKAGVGVTIVAALAIPATVVAWQLIGPPEFLVAGVVAAVLSAATSRGCWRTRQQPFELMATFRGKAVCLLRTTDQRELGQVSRGLLRAMERTGYR